MSRLRPGEGHAERRRRRKRSRRRSRRKTDPGAKGTGYARHVLVAALLAAGNLPLGRDLKALRRADFAAA